MVSQRLDPSKYLIHPRVFKDNRGEFQKIFDEETVKSYEPNFSPQQVNFVSNDSLGTLRGLHWQESPHNERKIVSCIEGEIWDVIVDLRPESKTYTCWLGFYLNSDNKIQMFVPNGFAHGYITISGKAKVLYISDNKHVSAMERGLHWKDPTINIAWPIVPVLISQKDLKWPYL